MMTTTKHKIEIPELPDGWKPVAYRPVIRGEHYLNLGAVGLALSSSDGSYLIVEKIKPKRITLEATGEVRKAFDK